jgi:hypothetical protein
MIGTKSVSLIPYKIAICKKIISDGTEVPGREQNLTTSIKDYIIPEMFSESQ